MNTHSQTQINLQTPGPLAVDFEKHYCGEGTPERRQARALKAKHKTVCAVLCKWRAADPQSDADARTLAAGFNLLDKTGRALNLDAATLGEGLDLVGLIRALQSIHDDADHALGTNADEADKPEVMRIDLRAIREQARAALSTLPALP